MDTSTPRDTRSVRPIIILTKNTFWSDSACIRRNETSWRSCQLNYKSWVIHTLLKFNPCGLDINFLFYFLIGRVPEIKSRGMTPAAPSVPVHGTEAPSLSSPLNDVFGSPRTNQLRPFGLLAGRERFYLPFFPLPPEFFDFIKELTSFP